MIDLDTLGEVFTRREALEAGANGRALTPRVRSGQVVRVGRGVYRSGGVVHDPPAVARLLRAAISHQSAAAWCGADLPFPVTTLHVTAPRSRGRRPTALLAVAGLPPPVPKLSITDADGRWIARADFAWPEDRVILECDGHAFHDDRATFVGDRRRWTALTRAGWRVVVVTWHDVVDRPARGRAHN